MRVTLTHDNQNQCRKAVAAYDNGELRIAIGNDPATEPKNFTGDKGILFTWKKAQASD